MGVDSLYFEDIEVGSSIQGESYLLEEADVVSFAQAWDPLPIHIDRSAAAKSPFGTLTAAGVHVLAIKQKLMHALPIMESVICTIGFDDVRFLTPARCGDTLTLSVDWREKRLSKSKTDRGIVVLDIKLVNQDAETVLSYVDTILMRCRVPN